MYGYGSARLIVILLFPRNLSKAIKEYVVPYESKHTTREKTKLYL